MRKNTRIDDDGLFFLAYDTYNAFIGGAAFLPKRRLLEICPKGGF